MCTHRYKFSAYPAGTYWYHSHSAFQREDGFYGKLIVRQPIEQEVHRWEDGEEYIESIFQGSLFSAEATASPSRNYIFSLLRATPILLRISLLYANFSHL
jgi:hypothetical protein